MDATFGATVENFAQLFIMHAKIGANYGPVIHVLMKHKGTADYAKVFDSLKMAAEKLDVKLYPITVITDFESALRAAVRQSFPDATLLGCLFHFCQAILRKAFAVGLKREYNAHGFLHEWVRDIIALPLLKPEKSKKWWDQHLRNGPQTEDGRQLNEKEQEFVDYIQSTWFNLFDFQNDWNHWLNNGPHTTNVAEGYHSRLNRLNAPKYASYAVFSDWMIGQRSTQLHQYIRWTEGKDIIKQKAVYADLHERVLNSKKILEERLSLLENAKNDELVMLWESFDTNDPNPLPESEKNTLIYWVKQAWNWYAFNPVIPIEVIREMVECEIIKVQLRHVAYLLADSSNPKKKKMGDFIDSTKNKGQEYFSNKPRKTTNVPPASKPPLHRFMDSQGNQFILEYFPTKDGVGLIREEFEDIVHVCKNSQERGVKRHFDQKGWLLCDSINKYMTYLANRSRENNALPNVHAMDSNFFIMGYNFLFGKQQSESEEGKVRRHEYEIERVKRWLFDRRGHNLFFHTDLVLIPINTPGHWTLAIIDNRKQTITYYDSMRSKGRAKQVFGVFDMFMEIAQREANIDVQYQQIALDVPQQQGGTECGVFSLAYASHITSGKEIISSPNQGVINQWRQLTGYLVYCASTYYDRLDFLHSENF